MSCRGSCRIHSQHSVHAQGTQSIGSLSSGDLEDPDFSKEQDLELKCARAFKAVLHFEQTHCLQVEVRCRRSSAATQRRKHSACRALLPAPDREVLLDAVLWDLRCCRLWYHS